MPYWKSRGQVYRSDSGGTYPCNNGDPQCDDDEAPEAEDLEPDWDAIAEDMEERGSR
jgi:hypothetical protein